MKVLSGGEVASLLEQRDAVMESGGAKGMGGITEEQLARIMDRSEAGVAALPVRGPGYHVAVHKSTRLVGRVDGK